MPKAVLEVTAKDQDGKEVFSEEKEFTVSDLYFKGGKQVAMAEWDVTATEHFDLGVRPLEPYNFTFVIPLSLSTSSVDLEAKFNYLYTRDETFAVKRVLKKVLIEQP